MSVHRCPDCVPYQRYSNSDCPTCGNTHYVHRNSHGRITHPATPEEYLTQFRREENCASGPPPSPQGYERRV